MTPDEIAGTYRLISWHAESDDGISWEPFGPGTRGLITYTFEGRMAGMLMKADRPASSASNLPAAPQAEQAQMAAGYLAYAGSYSVTGSTVIHHVELSLFPNWIGTDQVRHITMTEDGDMVLSTPPSVSRSGKTVVSRLRWRRLD